MKKLLWIAIIGFLAFLPEARAQTVPVTTLTAAGTTCANGSTAAGSFLMVIVRAGEGGATFTINANAGGNTIGFFASGDGGKTYATLSVTPSNSTTTVTSTTTTTAGSVWQANVAGYTNVCMVMTTKTSGNTIVNIYPSTASARSGGGGAGGTVTSVSGTANQIDSTGGATPVLSLDSAIVVPGTISSAAGFTSTGTTAGFLDLPQGTDSGSVAPCNVANSICWEAPTSVTAYKGIHAGVASTGLPHWANSANVITETISAITSGDATGNTSGSGNFCLVTNCVMVTPTLGAASATSMAFTGSTPGITLSGTTPYLAVPLEQHTQCSFSLTTSTLTLALSPVSLCTITLPNAAVVWRVNCQGGWSVTAGTTPTFAVGNKWAQTPSGVFGAANIDTTNAGVGVQGTTSSTSNGNILATGTLTTSATIFTTTWWTTFTGSATSGTYNPTASLTGTSATGTLVGFCTIQ